MSIKPSQTSWLPALNGRGLDMVKIAAAFFMVIDHVNFLLLDSQFIEMGIIGRATYPLFAYALAMAFWRIDDNKRTDYGLQTYAVRLFALGIIIEPILYAIRHQAIGNILFTLAFAAVFIALTHHLKKASLYFIFIICIVLQGLPPLFEYGIAGAILPAVILLCLRGEKSAYPFLFIFIFLLNMTDYIGKGLNIDMTWSDQLTIGGIAMIGSAIIPLIILRLCTKTDQTKRYLPKYFLHLFYPGHFILLWAFQYMWGLI